MSKIAIATLQPASDCRWSRPGYRVIGVPEQFQPETLWICTRTGDRRCIDAVECETCPHWELQSAQQAQACARETQFAAAGSPGATTLPLRNK